MQMQLDLTIKQNPYPGRYIAFEGIDGSGKTTQVKALCRYFEKLGRSVTTIQFPRKNEGLLASINKSTINGTSSIPKSAFQYLFTADYTMIVEETIIPALKRGDIVLTDRFHCWSSLAYGMWELGQEYDAQITYSLLIANGLLSQHHQFFVPDRTFYLAIDVITADKRMSKKATKDLYERKEILAQVIKGYEWLLAEFPNTFTVIDGKKEVEEVQKEMLDQIKQL